MNGQRRCGDGWRKQRREGGKEHEWRREEMTTEQGEERNLAAEE